MSIVGARRDYRDGKITREQLEEFEQDWRAECRDDDRYDERNEYDEQDDE